jgi:acyl-CoA thioesterase-2
MVDSQSAARGLAGATVRGSFAVDQVGDGTWRGRKCDPLGGRLYGGTLAAQLLAAARAATLGPTRSSNVELRFLHPADGGLPVDYHVERTHDGKSSAVRRVVATQNERTVAVGTVGFYTPRAGGWFHGRHREAEQPEALPETGLPHRSRAVTADHFDIRYYDESTEEGLVRRLWFRALEDLPAEAAVHECVLTFFSDIYFYEPICLEHGYQGNDRTIRYGTTHHSMWFHQPPVADDWLLIESRSPVITGGRGLVYGQVRTMRGDPVATIVQQVAISLVPTAGHREA